MTPHHITRATAIHYDLTVPQLRSAQRLRCVAWPRQMAMYLIRTDLEDSVESIGRHFGKDHSTVCHAVRSIEARWDDASAYDAEMIRLRAQRLWDDDAQFLGIAPEPEFKSTRNTQRSAEV